MSHILIPFPHLRTIREVYKISRNYMVTRLR